VNHENAAKSLIMSSDLRSKGAFPATSLQLA